MCSEPSSVLDRLRSTLMVVRCTWGDMVGQLNQALDNLETVLGEAGFGMYDVVRLNYFTTDVDSFFEAVMAVGGRMAESGCRASQYLTWSAASGLPPSCSWRLKLLR